MKSSNGAILNPYLPEYEYIPDGEPHVFGDRVYIYGSHDRFAGNVFCQNDYVCYSAPVTNLNDWKYEGVIFSTIQDPRTSMGGHQFWAPDVVKGKDGRYYLYYCPDSTLFSIGVAVCDSPAGRYQFYGLVKDAAGQIIGDRPGDTLCFDPGVFIDDDGRIYLYSGNAPRTLEDVGMEPKDSKVMELSDDMLTLIGEPRKLLPMIHESAGTGFEGHEFFEASSIRKIHGKYILVYSSITLHELCYAISDYPDHGYRYGGVVISNADIFEDSADKTPQNCFGNDHGGIEYINGQYYIFYHRQTNRTTFSRQGCAEPITIEADGRIHQAKMTSQGLYGRPLPGTGTYPASCAAHMRGALTPVKSDLLEMGMEHPFFTQDGPDFDASLLEVRPFLQTPRQYISNCRDGFQAMYRYFDFTADQAEDQGKSQEITILVKTYGTASGSLLIRTSENGPVLGRIPMKPSTAAEWNESISRKNVKSMFSQREKNWEESSGTVLIPEGIQELYFSYEGEGTFDFLSFTLVQN